MAILSALGRLGMRDRTTVHGLCRATFSTWANGTGAGRPDVVEAGLARKEGDRVCAAYNWRSSLPSGARCCRLGRTTVQPAAPVIRPSERVACYVAQCIDIRSNTPVIRTFKHKGLARLFEKSDHRGVPAQHGPRIERMLDRLDASLRPGDMDLPGYRFHPLKGERIGEFAVSVSGNWRMTFRFDGEDASDVNLEDYH